jgi:hypothetical protein
MKSEFDNLILTTGINFKEELLVVMHLIFLYLLKKYMNIKFYIHSEELRFLLLFVMLIFSIVYKSIIPSNFGDNITFYVVFVLGILALFLELNIFNRLRKRIKDKINSFNLLVFVCAIAVKLIYIFMSQGLEFLGKFEISAIPVDKIVEISINVNLLSQTLYIVAYIIAALIFLRPKETYSF